MNEFHYILHLYWEKDVFTNKFAESLLFLSIQSNLNTFCFLFQLPYFPSTYFIDDFFYKSFGNQM